MTSQSQEQSKDPSHTPAGSAGADWKIWQKPEVVKNFASRRENMPGVQMEIEVVQKLVKRIKSRSPRVLDVGCGLGFWLKQVVAVRPQAICVGQDGSAAMLASAKENFDAMGVKATWCESDFNNADWVKSLPAGKFDIIVSGLAIHHSQDVDKKRIYGQIFDLLAPGGLFVNVEHVASATSFGESLFDWAWAQYDHSLRQAKGEMVDVQTVFAERVNSDRKKVDKLTRPGVQLDWFREIGFADADCYGQYLQVAVLAGFKPPVDAAYVGQEG